MPLPRARLFTRSVSHKHCTRGAFNSTSMAYKLSPKVLGYYCNLFRRMLPCLLPHSGITNGSCGDNHTLPPHVAVNLQFDSGSGTHVSFQQMAEEDVEGADPCATNSRPSLEPYIPEIPIISRVGEADGPPARPTYSWRFDHRDTRQLSIKPSTSQ